MSALQTQPLAADQLAQVKASANQLENYMKGPAALALAQRYVHWQTLESSAHALGDRGSDILLGIFGDTFVGEHAQQDQIAAVYAGVLSGLDTGALELVPWIDEKSMHLGIAPRGTLPQPLGQWYAAVARLGVAIVVSGAVTDLAKVAWKMIDAWGTSQKLEADSNKLRADTSAKMTAAVGAVAQRDPQAAQALADALGRANAAANQVDPGFLATLAGSVRDVTQAGRGMLEGLGGLGLLLIAYMLYKSKWGGASA